MTRFLLLGAMVAALFYFGRRLLAPPPVMPRAEAAKLLGVAIDADEGTVIDAHRRLIAKVHPDVGGNETLAAQVNRARDIMLRA